MKFLNLAFKSGFYGQLLNTRLVLADINSSVDLNQYR
jgi:hypothetical protein